MSIPDQTMLANAIAYHGLGMSLIPLRAGTKKDVAVKWKPFQTRRASKATIKRWFGYLGYQPAVLLGDISGGLISRDFDDMAAYRRWSEAFPELAATLPTVKTSRGRHVYARAEPGAGVAAIGGKNYLDLGDGEFRCGSGVYNMLPPAIHPDGPTYTWTIPIDGGIPLLTVESTGFLRTWGTDDTQHTQQTQQAQQTQETQHTQHTQVDTAIGKGLETRITEFRDVTLPIGQRIEKAIQVSLPAGPGQRNRSILVLCRALKAIPECAGHPSAEFRKVVKAWHEKALPVIRTKEFEETWLDFNHTWANVRHAIGEGVMSDVLKAATIDDLPPQTRDYDRHETKLLVGICRELQRRAGDQPFFLGCRTAAELLGVEHNTAARWLRLLVADRIIETADSGTLKGHKAASYRYIGNRE